MGSKGSQTVTQSGSQNQSYTPNQPILGMGQQAGSMATAAAGAPFQQPVAPVAPFNPFQGLGFGETLGLQGFAQPYFNVAGNYLAGSAAPITGSDVQNYYNPMAANVTAQLQNIFGQQNVQNTGNLVQSAGGVGADRIGVGQANMANQQTLAAGQVYSQLYQQALQAAEQNKQMQAGAGFAFGQMGPAAQAAQQNAINQLLGVGAQQQQLSQAEMNAIYQNQLARIAYPFQTAQYLSGITAGLAPAMGGQTQGSYTGQTTYPSPSPFAQALGIGTGLLGMFGGMGGFGSGAGIFSGMGGSGAPMQWTPNYGPGAYGNGNSYPMFDEGGAVDSEYGKLADREKYQEYGSVIPYAAKGNPIAETFLHDVGYDDGGGIDPTLGQPAPMGLNLDPGSGLPFPGAGKVRGSPVPQEQLPTGQGGRSGLYGQQMIFHPPPSMPQGGGQQQSPMGGLGQLGNLAGSLGKVIGSDLPSLGSIFGGAGAAGDAAAVGADAADAAILLAKRGGGVPRMAPGGQTFGPGFPGPMPQLTGHMPINVGHPDMNPWFHGQVPQLTGHMPTDADRPPGMGRSPMFFTPGFGGGPDMNPWFHGQVPPFMGQMPQGMETGIQHMAPGGPATPMPQPSTPMGGQTMPPMPPPGTGPQTFPPPGASAQPPPMGPPGGSLPPGMPPPGQMPPGVPPTVGTTQRPPGAPGMPPPLSFSGTSPFSGPAPSRPPGMADGGPTQQQKRDAISHELLRREYLRRHLDPVGSNQPYDDDITAGQERRQWEQGFPDAIKLRNQAQQMEGQLKEQGPMEFLSGGKDPAFPGYTHSISVENAAGGPVDPMHPGEGFDDGGDVPVQPPVDPRGADEGALSKAWDLIQSGASAAGDFIRPYMGSGDRVPAMTSPADTAQPMKDQDRIPQDQVPMPTPRPIQTTAITPDQPRMPGDNGVIGNRKPYPEHPLDPNDPNYDPVLDPHNPKYDPNDPRLVFVDPTTRGDPRAPGVAGGSYRPGMTPNSPMVGPMGSSPTGNFQRPFPDATNPDNFARRMTNSPWLAVMNAGARMAQTRGPIGSVIGAGLETGARTLEGQRAALDNEEAINQKAEHLALLADQHLRQWSQMTPYQRQETDIQRQRLALLQEKMKEMTPYQHAQIEARIRTLHPEFDSLDPAQQDEIRMGIYAHPELISGGAQPEQPKVGDTKQFKQGLGRWDGKQWVPAG